MGYSLYHVGPIWDKQYSMGKLRENFELQVTALKSGFQNLLYFHHMQSRQKLKQKWNAKQNFCLLSSYL